MDDKRLGFSLGATEYIVKPVAKEVLLRKLRNLEKMGKIKRVLIVDNEPEPVRLIGNVLKEAGYQVTTGYNSKDAIQSIQNVRPDLVVLNLTMAEVSGFDVLQSHSAHVEIFFGKQTLGPLDPFLGISLRNTNKINLIKGVR